jgi:Holliday junction resolvasome RuvABC endonuclease subunit
MKTETQTKLRILAIDPGTHELGYALFEGSDLVDYGVKAPPSQRAPRELLTYLDSMLLRFFDERRLDVLVLEQNNFEHLKQNALLVLAVTRMKALAKRHNVTCFEYAPRTVRHMVCANGDATKKELSKIVAARFPELRSYLESNRKWRERYYGNIFDAVACGLCHLLLSDQDKHGRTV